MHTNQYLVLLALEAVSTFGAPALPFPSNLPFSLPAGLPSAPSPTGLPSSSSKKPGGFGGLSGLGGLGGLSGLGGFSGFGGSKGASSGSGSGSGSGSTGSTTPSTGGSGFSFPGLTGLAAGSGSSTENGITDKGACTPLTVIFARGTSEGGNVGTVAGPPFFSALRDAVGADKVTVQGVDYPASAAGNANLGADGGPTMAQLASQSLSQCPDSKIVLSGYSQGGLVVHNAATQDGFPASSIAGAVLFGDPFNGQDVQGVDSSKVLEICASGDSICEGGGVGGISQAHLSYGDNAQQASDFARQVAGL